MSDQNATTPRVFIARHGELNLPPSKHNDTEACQTGETEWTINGRCTGKSEIPLTANGVKQVQGTKEMLVGSGKLMDPAKFSHIFCSPRIRAQSTLHMLLGDKQKDALMKDGKVTITEDIAEWDYGGLRRIGPQRYP